MGKKPIKVFRRIVCLSIVAIMLFSLVGLSACCSQEQEEIDRLKEEIRLSADFVLNISMENTTVRQGEDFRVNVEFINQSGEGRTIGFAFGFMARIPGHIDFFDPNGPRIADLPEPSSVFLENNGVLRNICFWGEEEPNGIFITNRLPRGIHEMSFHFEFGSNGRRARIQSNTILLTVRR